TGIQAENNGCQSGRGKVTVDTFDGGPERYESGDMLDVPGAKELLAHVEHEQGLHAVIRKSLTGFCETQMEKPPRMSEERPVVTSSENGLCGFHAAHRGYHTAGT